MKNREDILYDKIMHSVSNIEQDKPVQLQAKEWMLFLNEVFAQILLKQNKFALITIIVLGISLSQFTIQDANADYEDEIYQIAYQTNDNQEDLQ